MAYPWSMARAPFPFFAGASLLVGNNERVVPGQPIPITWSATGGFLEGADLGAVTARIFLGGSLIYTKSGVPTSAPDNSTGPQNDSITIPGELGSLYTFGHKMLHLEVTGTGKAPGPYTDDAVLIVVPERLDPTWWQWLTPQYSIVDWKKAYTVSGKVTNKSSYGTMKNVHLELSEVDEDNNSTVRGDWDTGSMSPGFAYPVGTSITQSWTWLQKTVWVPTGPFGKDFTYSVSLSFEDAYGNSYTMVTSDPIIVHVSVPQDKTAEAGVALNAAASAAALAVTGAALVAGIITAPGGATVLAAAAVAYAAATTAGNLALDPPEPDLAYRQRVPIKADKIPKALSNVGGEFATLRTFVEGVNRVVAGDDALHQTRSRLISAREASDFGAVRLQMTSYQEIVKTMATDALGLLRVAKELDGVIKTHWQKLTPTVMREQLLNFRHAIPADLRETWGAEGLPEDTLAGIESVIRTSPLVEMALPFGISGQPLARAVLAMASEVEKKTPEVLKGDA